MALSPKWRGAALLMLVATLMSCDDDPGILAVSNPFGRVPVSVSISTPSVVIPIVGGEVQLTASVVTEGGQPAGTADVQWRSLAPSIVAVSQNGLATGLMEGTAKVEASLVNLADTVSLTVARVPASVTVSPDSLILTEIGETGLAMAQVFDLNGEPLDSTVTWSSSNSNIVTVDQSGLITAEGEGFATVTALARTARDELRVEVDTGVAALDVSVDSIAFSAIGDSTWFEVTAVDVLGREVDSLELEYTVANPNVAEVVGDTALVSRGAGVTVLTVRIAGTSVLQQIPVVVDLIPVSFDVFVELTPGGARQADVTTLETFTSFDAQVEALDANGVAFTPFQGVTWANSDPTVVRLDVTGPSSALLQVTDPGSTTIVAEFEGLADTLAYTVNEVASLSMALDRDTVFFAEGESQEVTPIFSTPDSADLCCGQAEWISRDSSVVTITPVTSPGPQIESSVLLQAGVTGSTWVVATRGSLVDSVFVGVTPSAAVGAYPAAAASQKPRTFSGSGEGVSMEQPRRGTAVIRAERRRTGGPGPGRR